jgi:hypothetical protein
MSIFPRRSMRRRVRREGVRGTVSDEPPSGVDEPMPTRTKIVVGLVGCVLVLAAAYGMMRMSSRAIRPDQPAPAGHYALPCGVCHSLSADAPAIEVAR